jgi:hypothetical protein
VVFIRPRFGIKPYTLIYGLETQALFVPGPIRDPSGRTGIADPCDINVNTRQDPACAEETHGLRGLAPESRFIAAHAVEQGRRDWNGAHASD